MNETRDKCGCCHGAGQLVCRTCNGVGARLVVVRGEEEEEWTECPECWGRKLLPCPECHGTGKVVHRDVA